MNRTLALASFILIPLASTATGADGLGGGGDLGRQRGHQHTAACIPETLRTAVDERINTFLANNPEAAAPTPQQSTGLYGLRPFTFFPMGGQLYQDIFTNNFVDLDTGPGLLDWNCSDRTYNGHQGNDTVIRSFAEQAIGVPVFSARAGVVLEAHDGEFDEFVSWTPNCANEANYVVINHDNGTRGYYWHLRSGSVSVFPGQFVYAGQQIGQIGSSGCSTHPHLHFEVQQGASAVEPYAGPCGPVESMWEDQDVIEYAPYAWDVGVSRTSPDTNGGSPYELPRNKQLAVGQIGYVWTLLNNLPAGATRRVIVTRPNGTTYWDNTDTLVPAYRQSWWWWSFLFNAQGTWNFEVHIDGATVLDIPFDVIASTAAETNRAPADLLGIQFDPPNPRAYAPLGALAQIPSRYLDDLDFDILRYEYQWLYNGSNWRTITTAATSDYIATPFDGGTEILCRVRATDGTATTPWHEATTTIRPQADDCENAVYLGGTGPHPIDTTFGTTDGPPHLGGCDLDGYDQVFRDQWYFYESAVTGTITLSTCNSVDFDTKVVIYEGTDCSDLANTIIGCNDLGAGCDGHTARLTVPATAGQTYLLRIGGYINQSGSGTFTITPTEILPCPADLDGSGDVGFNDLLQIMSNWGTCGGACPQDLNGNGSVDFGDLIAVMTAWGACP